MNLFDLKGPDFLIFYSVLLVIVVSVGVWLRQYFYRQVESGFDPITDPLQPYEVVYLAGGDKLSVNAALTSLIHQQLVKFNQSNKTLSIQAPMPPISIPWRGAFMKKSQTALNRRCLCARC